ncbi:hypothetical protein J1614_010227 [Plenodomus biglobosus]|nr:hypothetical protein J1614_010227 [Plenodomus biglobosus]
MGQWEDVLKRQWGVEAAAAPEAQEQKQQQQWRIKDRACLRSHSAFIAESDSDVWPRVYAIPHETAADPCSG